MKAYLKEKLRKQNNYYYYYIINYITFRVSSKFSQSVYDQRQAPRGAGEITLILDDTEDRFDLRGTSRLCQRLS